MEELYDSVIELFNEFFKWKENNGLESYPRNFENEYKNIKEKLNDQFKIEFLSLSEVEIKAFLKILINFSRIYNIKIQFKYTFECDETIKIYLHSDVGLSENSIKNSIFLERNGIKSIFVDCINKQLAGRKSKTGVEYKRYELYIANYKIHGVAPVFHTDFTLILETKELRMADDDTVMKYCTKKLNEELKKEQECGKTDLRDKLKLNEDQLDMIKKGKPRIEGFTWHHDPTVLGKMAFVKFDIHSANKHTGGSAIWGGGKK